MQQNWKQIDKGVHCMLQNVTEILSKPKQSIEAAYLSSLQNTHFLSHGSYLQSKGQMHKHRQQHDTQQGGANGRYPLCHFTNHCTKLHHTVHTLSNMLKLLFPEESFTTITAMTKNFKFQFNSDDVYFRLQENLLLGQCLVVLVQYIVFLLKSLKHTERSQKTITILNFCVSNPCSSNCLMWHLNKHFMDQNGLSHSTAIMMCVDWTSDKRSCAVPMYRLLSS